MKTKSYRRGYPVAVLIGIEENHAAIWQIYSQVAKPQQTIPVGTSRKDQKALYSFHEAIIDALRPVLKEGVKNIVVASPPRSNFGQDFLDHIKGHHSWLSVGANKAAFSLIVGSASSLTNVATLTRTSAFKQIIQENAAIESADFVEILEKRLNETHNLVLFSLQEAENLILNPQAPGKLQPEYLLLTNKYLENIRQKNRLNHLMQIAARNGVKTRVIDAESNAGKRLMQLGGIVCLAKK
jgi:stalled ribosome rescue protein Dom34